MKTYFYLFLVIPFCNAMDDGKNSSQVPTKKSSPLAIMKFKELAEKKRDFSPERALSPRKQGEETMDKVELLMAAEKTMEESKKMQQDGRLKRIPSATHLK